MLACASMMATSAFAQVSVVKEAAKLVNSGKPEDLQQAMFKIMPALSNPETAENAEAWFLAGKAAFGLYDQLSIMKQMQEGQGQQSEIPADQLAEMLMGGFEFMRTALPLDSVKETNKDGSFKLDKNGNPEKIKKGKLRGVESFGMCCSEKELHIGEGNAGIIEYSAEVPTGALVRDVAKLEKPETVFDIEVTWNRPDALSIVGLAREFSAILNRPLTLPPVDFTECDIDVNDEVKVVVEDAARCLRYTARVVTEMTPDAPSPSIMAKRLELCGVRSLGLAVDVTNYVMLELGQPMHAFDHRTLKDRTIVVR